MKNFETNKKIFDYLYDFLKIESNKISSRGISYQTRYGLDLNGVLYTLGIGEWTSSIHIVGWHQEYSISVSHFDYDSIFIYNKNGKELKKIPQEIYVNLIDLIIFCYPDKYLEEYGEIREKISKNLQDNDPNSLFSKKRLKKRI